MMKIRYGNARTPLPGLLKNHEPVIEPTYNPSLLSITSPAILPLPPLHPTPLEHDEVYSSLQHSPHHSLLYVCKQVYEEIKGHFNVEKNRRSSVFVSYPHGLHVLKCLVPGLLRQCKRVCLAGVYTSRTFNASRGAVVSILGCPHEVKPFLGAAESSCRSYNGNIIPDSAAELSSLITALFGPNPNHTIAKLELRIYYPGTDSYSTVWGDDCSPTVIALRSIYAGEISIEVWRGRNGTGVYLSATRPGMLADGEGEREGLRKRVVSTVWRRLEEGRRGEPRCGSWVVDPNWPGEEEEGGKEGQGLREGREGDVVVSTEV